MSDAKVVEKVEPPKERIVSVDALRGFDMFWIVGGSYFFTVIFTATGGKLKDWLVPQFDHAAWQGFHFYDLIFPLFVFVVGMSVVFSLGRLVKTKGKSAAYKRLIRRFVILYLLGIIYYGGISKGIEGVRLLGVLQRLALTYLFAGILFIHLDLRGMIIAFFTILLAYWAFLSFVPVPGVGHVSFAEGENWTNWIDIHYLPFFKWDGQWDPEGILSTLPAIGSAMLGVFASLILLDKKTEPMKKVWIYVGGGVVMVILGYLWGLQFPVIKKIWTSSYVLVAGGYSLILLGSFYYIMDVKKIRKWAQPFVWIGMNPITIYLAMAWVNFRKIAAAIGGGEGFWHNNPFGSVLTVTVFILLVFGFVGYLHKKKIFIRI
ncbi:MAG: DUF5009 domain-containing protein [Chlorobi bacterium]|nr:DUF5009 domain-containing protein [Chlorobiota bacterium]